MPLIPFPNVPNAPGVPAIPRSPKFPAAVSVSLGALQGLLWSSAQISDKWGIFDSKGKPVLFPASSAVGETLGLSATLSTVGIDFSADTAISTFPVEKGTFASYNKVQNPQEIKMTVALSGSESDRATLLLNLANARISTELYAVVMPEVRFVDYSLVGYDFSRTNERGATLLRVEITLKRIRQVTSQYTKANNQTVAPKSTSATPTVDGGKVQAKTPDTSTLKAAANKISSLLGG